MAEVFKNIEGNPKVQRGFYVVKMKRDLQTGHYMGVATWLARDIPLGGVHVNASGNLTQNRHPLVGPRDGSSGSHLHSEGPDVSTELSEKTAVPKENSITETSSAENSSHSLDENRKENGISTHQSEPSLFQASRFTERRNRLVVRDSYADPYDSYLL